MNELIINVSKIHTTELGIERIKRNLESETSDVVNWCKEQIINSNDIVINAKNWYVFIDSTLVNAEKDSE